MSTINIFKKMNNALKNISFKNLNREIAGYGYEYSFKSYMFQILLVLIAIVTVSYFFLLDPSKIIAIGIVAVIVFPVIVLSQFRYMNNNDRFEQMVNYMDQMILSFKQNPKILTAMESTLDLIDGKLKECVEEAIRIIKFDASENIYEKAFKVIEDEFRCSRVYTLHRFILNVERENSVNYQESIDNLYMDIRSWVTRTYQYQVELANVKKKIVIILGLSIGIAAVFTHVLKTAENQMVDEYAFNIIGTSVYQVATTLFLMSFIIIYAFLNSKINGHWLVNDMEHKKDTLIAKYIDYLSNYDKKKEVKNSIIASLFGVLLFVAGIIIKNQTVIVLGVAATIFILIKGNMKFKRRKKAVEKELLKEFPVWMRDVAINLNNMVVVRAIKQSTANVSLVMNHFLNNFLAAVEKEPNSIKPYINFLGMFNAMELQTAFKTLYAIKSLSKEDSQRQINDLIVRNQTLLETSERMRNQDSLAGVSFISMLPMVLLSFKLIIDLGIMLVAFISLSSGAF